MFLTEYETIIVLNYLEGHTKEFRYINDHSLKSLKVHFNQFSAEPDEGQTDFFMYI